MSLKLGYSYLIEALKLRVAGVITPCLVDSYAQSLVVPKDHDLVGHLVFALKNEGVHLEALQAILTHIDLSFVQAALDENPNGKYIRHIGFLCEVFTGYEFLVNITATGYTNLFSEKDYVTGERRPNKKYKVYQNGLGSLDYCPIIRRSPELERLLERDLFADLAQFIERVGGIKNLDRALDWAYLSETRSSFDIEGESLTSGKANRFVQLLHQAHQAKPLTEKYLTELHSEMITNPLLQEFSYRTKQNWLQRASSRFRLSDITYIPPSVQDNRRLMHGLIEYANSAPPLNSKEALLKAFTVSFGFVFNHPFLDGNGRISRFLIHHGLCCAGLLEDGLILPISVALSQHENDYLLNLESVSRPINKLWKIRYVSPDSNEIDAVFTGSADPYRFWDATKIAEFGLRMAHYSLDHTLIDEQNYLDLFDLAYEQINRHFDVQNKDTVNLIRMIASEGRLSNNRRKQFALKVPLDVLNSIEEIVQEVFRP